MWSGMVTIGAQRIQDFVHDRKNSADHIGTRRQVR